MRKARYEGLWRSQRQTYEMVLNVVSHDTVDWIDELVYTGKQIQERGNTMPGYVVYTPMYMYIYIYSNIYVYIYIYTYTYVMYTYICKNI